MLTSARLVLKHHRFEVGAAAIFGLLAAAAALVITYRLNAIVVPPGCFERWLESSGAIDAGECAGPVNAFTQISGDEAAKVFAAMAVLPFILGLLSGVSIVGRELEARTAQTAWALTPSRRRWLARQVGPILLVVMVAVAFAAASASAVEATLEATGVPWISSTFSNLTLHGWPVVGRALAAFSVGLAAGAVVGRTLPALIVGAVACLAILFVASMGHSAWYQANLEVIGDATSEEVANFAGAFTESAWLAPDGTIQGDVAAFVTVPADVGDQRRWLLDHGWKMVLIGVPATKAGQLVALDTVGFSAVALVVGLATVPVVDRRRAV